MLRENAILAPFAFVEDDLFSQLLSDLSSTLISPDQYLVKSGEQAHSVYFLIKGRCAIEQRSFRSRGLKPLKILQENDFFGEVAVYFECKRSMFVKALTHGHLAFLSASQFSNLLLRRPLLGTSLANYALEHYNDRVTRRLIQILPKLPLFKEVGDPQDLLRLIFKFKILYLQRE